mmetsp:Transcript_34160/g.97034  ORF Transcript_34160/g.97034 Transcript_34160/m.97034 type:complete len:222 (+) Transcript_34160:1288-1953(+)
MHMRLSTAPKAAKIQQLPQCPWLCGLPMTSLHSGQRFRGSCDFGSCTGTAPRPRIWCLAFCCDCSAAAFTEESSGGRPKRCAKAFCDSWTIQGLILALKPRRALLMDWAKACVTTGFECSMTTFADLRNMRKPGNPATQPGSCFERATMASTNLSRKACRSVVVSSWWRPDLLRMWPKNSFANPAGSTTPVRKCAGASDSEMCEPKSSSIFTRCLPSSRRS